MAEMERSFCILNIGMHLHSKHELYVAMSGSVHHVPSRKLKDYFLLVYF